MPTTKGQLISECLFENEKFDKFLLQNLKSGQINKVKKLSDITMIVWAI